MQHYYSCLDQDLVPNLTAMLVIHCLRTKGDYDVIDPKMLVEIKEQHVTHSRSKSSASKIVHKVPVQHALTSMKLNVESTDTGKQCMMEIAGLVADHLLVLTLVVACLFAGAEFLTAWLLILRSRTGRSGAMQMITSLPQLQNNVGQALRTLGTREGVMPKAAVAQSVGAFFDWAKQRGSFSARHFYLTLARAFGVF